MLYGLLRRLLFTLSPEKAHHVTMNLIQESCNIGFLRQQLANRFQFQDASLEKNLFGLRFSNPVGLGAGFDKNAKYLTELETLGFGFVEIGTVTPKGQAGNDKPRLFRLPEDNALINRMGFNNDGVDIVRERLAKWRKENPNSKLLIGGNIGKNKVTPNEDAWKDYEICFDALHPYVDFFVVNVSSPNTPGLRELQEKDALQRILMNLQARNAKLEHKRPILLKIAPDLTTEQLDDVVALATEIKLDGLVATNTTISREGLKTPSANIQAIGAGGLSGKPVQQHSTQVVQYLRQQTGGTIPIIGSGGIFTGEDAAQKLTAGADLIEVWTGFIYEGPYIVKNICEYLSRTKTNRNK
ncbi:quinone-dependent dihydroorotate dehydrogenase [Flavisolibacter tropicus]|uniref:Dihydroorotate dehydrogenase (quinone) n=1 Tax=Flavisolibacter tropicus TaxID=1492898 RepID=A0A172U3D3_9BACT|nr:quinone-dependent dihydroorotate dehydrogenase [Flavisolibacter tropicus]ANE53644.1 dihydroorotate dehydrogenase [Flavisolibacter tropicus]